MRNQQRVVSYTCHITLCPPVARYYSVCTDPCCSYAGALPASDVTVYTWKFGRWASFFMTTLQPHAAHALGLIRLSALLVRVIIAGGWTTATGGATSAIDVIDVDYNLEIARAASGSTLSSARAEIAGACGTRTCVFTGGIRCAAGT